jgi:polysaccharide biosynthesis/export protein
MPTEESATRIGWARNRIVAIAIGCVLVGAAAVSAQQKQSAATTNASATANAPSASPTAYILGPDDQVTVRALDVDEIDGKTLRVDPSGYVDVPLIGKVKAAGLTVSGFESELTKKLAKYVREPQISVTVSEYRSQPVSVLGAVNTPGVYNVTGPNTLEQMLSRAGGLRNDAGNSIHITRASEWGPIPLPSAKVDPSGKFSTADVSVKGLLDAKDPQANIVIEPTDVISVPKADLVYVVGAVNKPGGFILSERENMSALQAVSMAEGLNHTAASKRAKIIRGGMSGSRQEIPVNLQKILSGTSPDIPLLANDILFVPNNGPKSATYKVLEAALSAGTGVAIYRF